MKSQATITSPAALSTSSAHAVSVSAVVSNLLFENALVRFFALLFSAMLDEKVTTRRALSLIQAQIAFGALLLSAAVSMPFTLATFAWFCLSVYTCKRAFR